MRCRRCQKEFAEVRASARFCSVKCRVAFHRKSNAMTPEPIWLGRRVKMGSERQELALKAAEIIETYKGAVTLRQVYYRLVAANEIPNTERSYKRLGDIIVEARKSGLIGWGSIEDRGRSIAMPSVWTSPREFKRTMRYLYDEDRWETQNQRVAVVIEKAALAGIVEPICRQWQVPFVAARGYSSATLLADASVQLRGHVVLYLGDHDPSGTDMTRDWQDRLDSFASGCHVWRIGLTPEQIAEHNLPPQPVKNEDSRAKEYQQKHGADVWELDALPPDELATLVELKIRAFIDNDAWLKRETEIEAARSLV